MIQGIEPVDTGTATTGTNVEIGYYDQEHSVLHNDKTIFEEIQDDYPDLTHTVIRNVLAAFLFTGDDVFKPISLLSGGEKGRVSLAKLMLSKANFLLLDEPTNHLDIMSKEILETALNNYTGTVLYVSHDRYFINKTATRIMDLTNHKLLSYDGDYQYYLEKKETMEQIHLSSPSGMANTTTANTNGSSESKLNWQEQKSWRHSGKNRNACMNRLKTALLFLKTKSAPSTKNWHVPNMPVMPKADRTYKRARNKRSCPHRRYGTVGAAFRRAGVISLRQPRLLLCLPLLLPRFLIIFSNS